MTNVKLEDSFKQNVFTAKWIDYIFKSLVHSGSFVSIFYLRK